MASLVPAEPRRQGRARRRGGVLAGLWAVAALTWPAAGAARPFTVDDLLKLEDVGRVEAAPDGQGFVYEKVAPYDQGHDWGRMLLDVFGWSRSQIYRSGAGAPRPLFTQAAGRGYLIGQASPSGRRLAIIVIDHDRTRLGVYDFARDSYREFDVAPDIETFLRPQWASDDVVVVAAAPAGRTWGQVSHPDVVTRLPAMWAQMRRGETATATVIRTGPQASPPVQAGPGALVRIEVTSGTVTRLASGDFIDVAVAPDGRSAAGVRYAAPLTPDAARPADPQWRTELVVLDLTGVRSAYAPCPACTFTQGNLLLWSPSGRRLAFLASPQGPQAGLRVADVRTRRLTTVSSPALDIGAGARFGGRVVGGRPPQAAWIGEQLAVRGVPVTGAQAGSRGDWYVLEAGRRPANLTAGLPVAPSEVWSVGGQAVAQAGAGLWALRTGRGPRPLLAAGAGHSLSLVRVSSTYPDSARLGGPDLVVEESGPAKRYYRIRAHDLAVERLDAQDGELVALSASGASVLRAERGNVGELAMAGAADRVRFNTRLAGVEPGRPVRLDYKDAKGRNLIAWLLLPSTYKAGTRLPLVVEIYPSQVQGEVWRGEGVSHFYSLNAQLFAAHGYAVLFPSVPLDLLSPDEEPMGAIADPVLRAVDQAVAEGYADPDRLGVHGQSFGGYGVQALVTQTSRFKAAISTAGYGDLISAWGTLGPGNRVLGPADTADFWLYGSYEGGWMNMGGAPWQAVDRYIRNSPVLRADRIETPLMLVQGDLDGVPVQQSEEMISALRRQGKEAEFVRYWGENHVLVSPANIRDLWMRMFAWYDGHLGAPAAPAPD